MFLQFEQRQQFHARRVARDLRPVHRTGRRRALQGRPEVLRLAAGAVPAVPSQARQGAAVAGPAVLDRGPELRRGVPRAPHRAAVPGRLAPALHPGRAHPLAAARSQQAAVGGLRHRGPARHSRRAEGQLRALQQDAPRDHRRRIGHRAAEGAALDHARADRLRRRGGPAAVPRRPRADGDRALLARARAQRRAHAGPREILARHRASTRRASAPVPSASWRARACSRWRGCAASRPATWGRC